MSKFTFLTEEECFGKNKLDVLKRGGAKAAITDFAILLGGYVKENDHIDADKSLSGRVGYYWTKSYDDVAHSVSVSDFRGAG